MARVLSRVWTGRRLRLRIDQGDRSFLTALPHDRRRATAEGPRSPMADDMDLGKGWGSESHIGSVNLALIVPMKVALFVCLCGAIS